MSEFTKFESTKSIRRWRPPKGTADFERSRVSGCRRSPRPPAITIASTRARRGMGLSARGRAQTPRRVEVREAKVLALEPPSVSTASGERGRPLEGPRHLAEALELGVVLGDAALGVVGGGAGRDQELPVGGLEQQELASPARGPGEDRCRPGRRAWRGDRPTRPRRCRPDPTSTRCWG